MGISTLRLEGGLREGMFDGLCSVFRMIKYLGRESTQKLSLTGILKNRMVDEMFSVMLDEKSKHLGGQG